ncbi:MAG: DciA family protein [Patescibacteria group bacterium]
MAFTEINKILNKNFKNQSGLAKSIQASLVCDEFDKILENKWGSVGSSKAKAMYYKDKILTIASLSSVMAQEIKLHERDILEELNSKFSGMVDSFRYLV